MTGILVEHDPGVAQRVPGPPVRPVRGRTSLPMHWPLTVTLLGFPLWWALGLRTVVPMALALVMADQLLRKRRLVLPSGFTLWLLFIAWLALGAFVLFADAPGAAPGGGPSRFLVFGYRMAWYLAATVYLLWVTNLRESELPTRWVYQLLGFMFVVTTFGGLLGVLAPHLEWTSPFEMLMPRGLRKNSLIESIAHPAVADIQTVLGRAEARPKAPFPFANTWGSCLSLYLPFFVIAWFRYGKRWQRITAPLVLAVAAIPIVYSLNRGLWLSLGLGVVLLVLLQLRGGRTIPIVGTVVVLFAVSAAFLLSPLGAIFQERLAHQHSNERRGELISRTVTSTLEGSPVVGFGSTRDVQGSFASISGAATPDCSACGVPPLGTQGHLWGVIFSAGVGGALLFLAFFVVALSRCWRCRTTAETLCTFVLAFFGLQLLVYDTLGMPLLAVMTAIGLVAREQLVTAGQRSSQLMAPAVARLRAWLPILVACTLAGALAGAAFAAARPVYHAARVSILLAQPPVYISGVGPDTGATTTAGTEASPGNVTIDTEAALLISRQSLSRVVGSRDTTRLNELRNRVRITAPPNTSVLTLEIRNQDADAARREASALARSYLVTRRVYLDNRRDQALALLREQLATLRGPAAGAIAASKAAATRDKLEEGVTTILLTTTRAGEVIRTQPPARVRRQSEVPITTGAAIGLALGVLLMAALPGTRPRRPWRRRRR